MSSKVIPNSHFISTSWPSTVLFSASIMTLLSSFVILSVIISVLANGFGRVAFAEALVVLPTITYPIVGEELKSDVMVDMIRSSAALMALLSAATL